VKKRLEAIHIPSLKIQVVNQLCEATGGPCKYAGRDMKMSHAGLEITSREFDIGVEDLVATLDKLKVGEREKKELLALLGPMKKDIVQKP
jgi:hemoglobin